MYTYVRNILSAVTPFGVNYTCVVVVFTETTWVQHFYSDGYKSFLPVIDVDILRIYTIENSFFITVEKLH